MRLLAVILIVTSSIVTAIGQTPDARDGNADKTVKASSGVRKEKLRDLPFPSGIDLQFIIKELASDLDLNVLFDPDSFRMHRKTLVDLRNVTASAAIDYILLQERLFFEEIGPRTILVASSVKKRNNIPTIGIGGSPLTDQLAQYFGVNGGMLIETVRRSSPASKAGLKAGDVIVEVDGVPVKGSLGAVRSIDEKSEGDVILTIVRERKRQTISVTPERGLDPVLRATPGAPAKPSE